MVLTKPDGATVALTETDGTAMVLTETDGAAVVLLQHRPHTVQRRTLLIEAGHLSIPAETADTGPLSPGLSSLPLQPGRVCAPLSCHLLVRLDTAGSAAGARRPDGLDTGGRRTGRGAAEDPPGVAQTAGTRVQLPGLTLHVRPTVHRLAHGHVQTRRVLRAVCGR